MDYTVANSELPDPSTSVREFYNQFTDSRFSSYLRHKNQRIDKAITRILSYVRDDMTILEIGCGLGIVTERLAPRVGDGAIWACDISERATQQAGKRITAPNVHFRAVDVIHQFDHVREWIPGPVDLVVMIDVIEHLPMGAHGELFRNLRSVMTENASLVLTFPSPQYQIYLRENKPHELQIIDEVIELSLLTSIASESGFNIAHFSLEDAWRTNQYCHCVLKTCVDVLPLDPWTQKVDQATSDLVQVLPDGALFVLADEDQWGTDKIVPGRRNVPFLERDGRYWGPPPDDGTAIGQLERLRREGADFMVFAWPSFWWLEHYSELNQHLRSTYRCILQNERLLVFDLRL